MIPLLIITALEEGLRSSVKSNDSIQGGGEDCDGLNKDRAAVHVQCETQDQQWVLLTY